MLQNLVDGKSPAPLAAGSGDMRRLEEELKGAIRGEVRFDDGSRALYATDASNYRQVPIGVVIPRTVEDVIETVRLCHRHGAPVLSRGGGTSLCGQCCNVAVVIDFSKYLNRIISIDPDAKTARVQPGLVLDDLRDAANRHGLTFAPDPATHNHNTLGGMIGNNSCGPHSVIGCETVRNIVELDILTYDGTRMTVGAEADHPAPVSHDGGPYDRCEEIHARLRDLGERYAEQIRRHFPQIPRRVSGYNLNALLPESGFNLAQALVGSEGTCVVVLEATVRLLDNPPHRALAVLGYKDVYEAGDHVPQVMRHKPIALEGIDDRLVADMDAINMHPQKIALLPEGAGWLLVEFGGATQEEANGNAQRMIDALQREENAPAMKLFGDPSDQHRIWKVRESGLGATAHVPDKPITWEGWEDSAVPPERLGDYLRKLRALFEKYDYSGDLYGHFGQGCVHTRIDFDLETAAGIEKYKKFIHEAAHLVVGMGGSISGEHGDGQSKAELLPVMFGEELMQAFREFKGIWDPQGRMNPGKVVDPYPITANLRLGAQFDPPPPQTYFAYPEDKGSFVHATLRCVGVGKCRRSEGGVMCPSYMATREELHTTRGRARLLFEMIKNDPIASGWRSREVREALDLCLACKGCKSDCPVNVDMATYKAEFYAHYYRRRLRPREAYSMGLIYWWCRAAAHAPRIANGVGQTPGLRELVKLIGGIAPKRRLPRFAGETFRRWFERRRPARRGRPAVLLWPDTFNDHFRPWTAIAATEVLEDAGYEVIIPRRALCCARPLYGWGMLDLAKHQLRQVLEALGPQVEEGIPVVGLEPACMATFKDELPNLFPHDARAQALSERCFLLGEFLENEAHYRPPPLTRRTLVHTHCNQHAIFGTAEDQALFTKMGLDYEMLDAGCCGMAGAFGFEREHYEVAMQCGERVLLPAVRRAAPGTLILTNGYSCREQIEQSTERRALHLADLLQLALRERRRS
jgi:FAD/FMN-containing dehydrogenase/Fe-S oxidoreductase